MAPGGSRARAGPGGVAHRLALLPLAGVYQPIWEYDVWTLGEDLSAHLVFGSVTAAVFAALTREGS